MERTIGIVVIGRNEGERLQRCLQNALNETNRIVYVDSGSTDQSVAFAKALKIDVVELDMSLPFSAARARNEGAVALSRKYKNLEFIQFVDGDCQFASGWINTAFSFLHDNAEYAIAAGRRRELHPDKTVYNLLCDIEWDTAIGEADACGGDFLIRKTAFDSVDGFNPAVVAGEEPDLCYRLRKNNWKVYRIEHDMTFHDANMTKFSQWCKRSIRAGHAYLQGYVLHSADKTGYNRKAVLKDWIWGLVFPATVVLLGLILHPLFFFLFIITVVRLLRIAAKINSKLNKAWHSLIYGAFIILSNFTQLYGQCIFILRSLAKKSPQIIEHK